MTFLKPTDPEAFVDFPEKKEIPLNNFECPLCFGHGGWNLTLLAYSLHGKENTPENRHKFCHFRAACIQCYGYGYVTLTDLNCIHEFKSRTIGNCLHEYTCTKCGQKREVDSSG